MNWSLIDRLSRADPLIDMDFAVHARVTAAMGMATTFVAFAIWLLQVLTHPLAPGLDIAAGAVGIVTIAVTLAGLYYQRPQLVLAIQIATILMALTFVAAQLQGVYPPAFVLLPSMPLAAYLVWGPRGLAFVGIPAAILLITVGYWVQTPGQLPEPDAYSRSQLMLAVQTGFSGFMVLLLGSTYRSALNNASQSAKLNNEKLALALDEALAAKNARSQFLANMSHEIRTPLNGVLGIADVMSNAADTSSEQRQQLELIQESGATLLRLLNNVLDTAKFETDSFELEARDYDVGQLVIQTGNFWRVATNDKDLQLVVDTLNLPVPRLNGDPTRIQQILNNLIGNAVKFTARGRINICVVQTIGEGNPCTKIAISDTGPGISGDKLDLIFEPFRQAEESTTRAYGGTGLGLSISQQLATRMGARIDLKSTLNSGSTFTLILDDIPAIEPALPSAELVSKNDHLVVQNPGRILIVDDVATNRFILEAILKQLCGKAGGSQIDCATDGRSAIEAAKSKQYDLIMMDIQMPGMDGIAATKAIRDLPQYLHTPIIAVTARVQPGEQSHLLDQGFDDYLPKPIERRALIELLDRVSQQVSTSKIGMGRSS